MNDRTRCKATHTVATQCCMSCPREIKVVTLTCWGTVGVEVKTTGVESGSVVALAETWDVAGSALPSAFHKLLVRAFEVASDMLRLESVHRQERKKV